MTKTKRIMLALLLVSSIAISSEVIPVRTTRDPDALPVTPRLSILLYYNIATEAQALKDGEIDIMDRPISQDLVDSWASIPDKITLRDHAELGMKEIDINNKKWPTGCELHKFFDERCERCLAAREFRIALNYLVDKLEIVRDLLKGFGYILNLPIPPAHAEYGANLGMYRDEKGRSLVRDYSPMLAAQVLENAGFRDWYGSGFREWRSAGVDKVYGTSDDGPIEKLPELIFYVRNDESERIQVGDELESELQAIHLKVHKIQVDRSYCYRQVMVLYNYHIYTGGWRLSPIPDTYYDLYSSETYYGKDIGWSPNYVGFCHRDFDIWAAGSKHALSVEEAREACQQCGIVFSNMCASIPLWSLKAVQAYRTGWYGVVNDYGYGIDNYYTFLRMHANDKQSIHYGFCGDVEDVNVVCSNSVLESKALRLQYDSLLGYNPFNGAFGEKWLAGDYSVGTWYNNMTQENCTFLTFNLIDQDNDGVPDPTFHYNGHSGRHVSPEDVRFSLWFTYDCGPSVSARFSCVAALNDTRILNSTALEVYLNTQSIWAPAWIGTLPILNRDVWLNASDWYGWGYDVSRFGNQLPDFNPVMVRWYHPMEDDADHDGVIDLKQDGTGAWCFDSYSLGSYINYVAYGG